jgi:hypothetical protein
MNFTSFRRGASAVVLAAALQFAGTAWAQAPVAQAALAQRHALIIAIGEYSDPAIPPLRGMRHDVASAGRIAEALSVPASNVRLLRDHDATAAAIRYQIRTLTDRVAAGDRVFIYYSGHGTRVADAAGSAAGPAGGPGTTTCTEGLLAADGRVLGNADLAEALAPLARKADKLMVFYDACYSGGVATEAARSRSLRVAVAGQAGAAGAEEVVTPKFVRLGTPTQCAEASNVRSRSLAVELGARQTWPGNVIHIAASRSDEVSFDSSWSGGYATMAWRDCLLGEARDIDGSGAVTVAEVSACAQLRLNRLLTGLPGVAGQTLVLAGNAQIVPGVAPALLAAPAVAAAAPAPGAVAPAVARVLASNAQVLTEVHAQRDAARAVELRVDQPRLVAGRDALGLEVRSPRNGHVYIALAHADGRGLTLLYPNALDEDNRIAAGVALRLPGPKWKVLAQPPAGTETLLAVVTDRPRKLADLLLDPDSRASPFMRSLVDARGRAMLHQVLVGGEAFGAALAEVETVMPAGR